MLNGVVKEVTKINYQTYHKVLEIECPGVKSLELTRLLLFKFNTILDFYQNHPQVFKHDNPEMMIKFGPYATLAGYPPWPVHLTEIISLPTCRMISPYSFLDCLNRYYKIEKRVGK